MSTALDRPRGKLNPGTGPWSSSRGAASGFRATAARIERAAETERRRIALDIHDQIGQVLVALKIDVARLKKRLTETQRPEALVPELDAISDLIDLTANTVRQIASDLRPRILDDLGLAAAIRWQAREFETRVGIRPHLTLPESDIPLADDVATAIFRIFQEAMTNVARHAAATLVWVRLRLCDKRLHLEVRDNGRGFASGDSPRQDSLGLTGMRERALLVGGRAAIQSAPGRGTTVTVEIPIDANSLS